MQTRPEPPPEGKLIADAAARNDLSIREAARRAGISYGRWRQITSGYQNVSPGEFAAVHAPARTLARMAAVVGVTPEQMEGEGQRPDAAEILRENRVTRLPVAARPPVPDLADLPPMFRQLPPDIEYWLDDVSRDIKSGNMPRTPDEAGVWNNQNIQQ